MQTSITILSRSKKKSSKFGAIKNVNSERPDKLLNTEYFGKKGKKGKLSSEKKISFFHLVLLSITNIKKHFIWVHHVFWHLFVPIIRYKIVSVRVRKSSENVFEKGYLFVGKTILACFFSTRFIKIVYNR